MALRRTEVARIPGGGALSNRDGELLALGVGVCDKRCAAAVATSTMGVRHRCGGGDGGDGGGSSSLGTGSRGSGSDIMGGSICGSRDPGGGGYGGGDPNLLAGSLAELLPPALSLYDAAVAAAPLSRRPPQLPQARPRLPDEAGWSAAATAAVATVAGDASSVARSNSSSSGGGWVLPPGGVAHSDSSCGALFVNRRHPSLADDAPDARGGEVVPPGGGGGAVARRSPLPHAAPPAALATGGGGGCGGGPPPSSQGLSRRAMCACGGATRRARTIRPTRAAAARTWPRCCGRGARLTPTRPRRSRTGLHGKDDRRARSRAWTVVTRDAVAAATTAAAAVTVAAASMLPVMVLMVVEAAVAAAATTMRLCSRPGALVGGAAQVTRRAMPAASAVTALTIAAGGHGLLGGARGTPRGRPRAAAGAASCSPRRCLHPPLLSCCGLACRRRVGTARRRGGVGRWARAVRTTAAMSRCRVMPWCRCRPPPPLPMAPRLKRVPPPPPLQRYPPRLPRLILRPCLLERSLCLRLLLAREGRQAPAPPKASST